MQESPHHRGPKQCHSLRTPCLHLPPRPLHTHPQQRHKQHKERKHAQKQHPQIKQQAIKHQKQTVLHHGQCGQVLLIIQKGLKPLPSKELFLIIGGEADDGVSRELDGGVAGGGDDFPVEAVDLWMVLCVCVLFD